MDPKEIGSRLRALRKEARDTQEELAHRSGMHVTFISRVERGLELPSLSTLGRLARALKIHPAKLLGGEIQEEDLPAFRRLWGAVSALPASKAAALYDLFEAAMDVLEASEIGTPRRGRPRLKIRGGAAAASKVADKRGRYKRN